MPTMLLWRGWLSLTPPMLAGWLISGQFTILAAARDDFVSVGGTDNGPILLTFPKIE